MSDENEHKIEVKSDSTSADIGSIGTVPPIDSVPPRETADQELYHSKSFWTTWVFSQDAKWIGVQYACTAIAIGLVAMVLSWGMRLQLGFPDTFSFFNSSCILSVYYHARYDHGNISSYRFVPGRIW